MYDHRIGADYPAAARVGLHPSLMRWLEVLAADADCFSRLFI
jgi:hypothetical protein